MIKSIRFQTTSTLNNEIGMYLLLRTEVFSQYTRMRLNPGNGYIPDSFRLTLV